MTMPKLLVIDDEPAILEMIQAHFSIRGYQVRRYPGRYAGTTLTNPDFSRLAELFGAVGQIVARNEKMLSAKEAEATFQQWVQASCCHQ